MRVSRPVCGCNGKTYLNECEARHAKVAIDTTGACKKPPAADGRAGRETGCQKEEAREGDEEGQAGPKGRRANCEASKGKSRRRATHLFSPASRPACEITPLSGRE